LQQRKGAVSSESKVLKDESKILKEHLARRRVGDAYKVLAQIPHLFLSLKPCVLANPIAVQQYLSSESLSFDVVLFDDASQIAVEDAMGAMARGKQVIIAGDTQQLPPLSLIRESKHEFISILEAARRVTMVVAKGQSPHFGLQTLHWHYRSENESLVTFARQHFYPTMISFPSTEMHPPLTWRVVASGQNLARETRLLMEVLLADSPSASLGVITIEEEDFGLLLDEIAQNPETTAQINGKQCFVKGIQNVQGDECDTVILVLGDKTPSGVITERYGSYLLNVATTRARRRMIVMSTISPTSLTGDSLGVTMLRNLYTLTQERITPTPNVPRTDPLLEATYRHLVQHGYRVDVNVGRSAYQIPLAVHHPRQPDSYILAIDTDDSHKSLALTTAHREYLIPKMLEDRGWNLLHLEAARCVETPETLARLLETALKSALFPKNEVN
jgi:hypothetical protein